MAKKNRKIEKKLHIDFRISGKMNELIKKLHLAHPNNERSGIARIQKCNGYYRLIDIKFPKQKNDTATTEMTNDGLSDLLENIFTENPTTMGEYNCWIHSHHTMSCFWSGTDEQAKKSFNDGAVKYRWSVVTAYTRSNFGEIDVKYKCALNIFKPIELEFDINVTAEPFNEEEFLKENYEESETIISSINDIKHNYSEKLKALNTTSIIEEKDINDLKELLNVEDNEDTTELIIDLLKDEEKKRKNILANRYELECKNAINKVFENFGGSFFDQKVKELKDNIVQPTIMPYTRYTFPSTGYPYNNGKQKQSLFENDDYEEDFDGNQYYNPYPRRFY